MTFVLTLMTAAAAPICEPPQLTASQPADRAVDVPTRVSILGAFSGDCGSTLFTLTLTDPDGTVVFDEAVDLAQATGPSAGLIEATVVELQAETVYQARFEGESTWDWSFTTGTEATRVIPPESIAVTVGNATGFTEDQVHFVEASVTIDTPTDVPVILRIGGREVGFLGASPGVIPVSVVAPAGEFCVEAAVRQPDGNWVLGAEECVTPMEEGGSSSGCSTSPGHAPWALLLLAAPFLARRRATRA